MNSRESDDSSRSTFISLEIQDKKQSITEDVKLSTGFSKILNDIRTHLANMNKEVNYLENEMISLGKNEDSHALREKINISMKRINKEVIDTERELKELSKLSRSSSENQILKQTALEYGTLLNRVELTDRTVIKKCQNFIKNAKLISEETNKYLFQNEEENENFPLMNREYTRDQNQQKLELSGIQNEIAYNESLINEREEEIQNIVRASNLINELFQNIGILVTEQQDLIDNIEANADFTRDTTSQAVRQLEKTQEKTIRKTSRICYITIIAIIISIFLLSLISSIF